MSLGTEGEAAETPATEATEDTKDKGKGKEKATEEQPPVAEEKGFKHLFDSLKIF